jgi:hypothetical protein
VTLAAVMYFNRSRVNIVRGRKDHTLTCAEFPAFTFVPCDTTPSPTAVALRAGIARTSRQYFCTIDVPNWGNQDRRIIGDKPEVDRYRMMWLTMCASPSTWC